MRGRRDRSIFTKAGPVTIRSADGEVAKVRAYNPIEVNRVIAGYQPERAKADQSAGIGQRRRSRLRHRISAEERARRALEKNRHDIEAKRSHG